MAFVTSVGQEIQEDVKEQQYKVHGLRNDVVGVQALQHQLGV